MNRKVSEIEWKLLKNKIIESVEIKLKKISRLEQDILPKITVENWIAAWIKHIAGKLKLLSEQKLFPRNLQDVVGSFQCLNFAGFEKLKFLLNYDLIWES